MKVRDLDSLFRDELRDAYDFEHQIVEALPKMAESASDPELQKAFRAHLEQTRGQIARLEQVFERLGEKPERKTCEGMKGLIKEGEELLDAKGDEDAIDAGLIGAAQRVEHYEMAAYGTLRTFAETLGHPEEARLLQQILDQEAKTDERLTRLAERGVNRRATDGESSGEGTARTRSRTTNGELTKEELYRRAQELDIEGRSSMSKQQLQRAISRRS